MRRIYYSILTLLLLCANNTYGQVEDINFIISPKASYHFYDSKNTAKSAFAYGLEAGFGFG